MKKTTAIVAALVSTLWIVGCGPGSSTTDQATKTGSTTSAVLGNDFTGNYVKIHGMRSVAADTKYPCLNEFQVCLGLDPAGATASIKDLCPSDDTPEGTWNFTYIVYDDPSCTSPLANFGCAPVMSEWLYPGHNHNDVRCITRNADESFDLCVMDPVTGAGSEACPPCAFQDPASCNP